jgi:hypothetical protein
MSQGFVIVQDGEFGLVYFVRVGLGVFWECSQGELGRQERKIFSTRAAAARVLHKYGKHRQGWRILPAERAAEAK